MRISLDAWATLRSHGRRPGFVILVAGTLGLGMGAAAAMLTLVRQVVLEPMPVRSQDRLVVAWGNHRTRDFDHFPFTLGAFERIGETAASVVSIAATEPYGATERLVEGEAGPVPVRWSRILGDFAGTLGLVPAAGRLPGPEDDRAGGPLLAVVSHRFWQQRWSGQDTVLGATLRVAANTYTVIGVLPEGFDYPRGTDVWTPLRPDVGFKPPQLELDLLARLAPGASIARLRDDIAAALASDPDLVTVYADVMPVVRPLPDVVLGGVGTAVMVLGGAGLLVLFVAFLNAANLAVLRATERLPAVAMRRALGADNRTLLAAVLAESTGIGCAAGLLAAILAWIGLTLLPGFVPEGLARLDGVHPEAATWGWIALLVTLAVALLVTVTHAVQRTASISELRRRGEVGRAGRRVADRVTIAAQAGLALWATVGALLLTRTLRNLDALDAGFDEAGLYVVKIDNPWMHFQLPGDAADIYRRIAERIAAVPNIGGVTPVLFPPVVGNGGFDVVPVLEGAADASRKLPYLSFELVQPGYFDVMRLPIVEGRRLDEADGPGALPVVVVNEAAAHALWPGEDAIGKQIVAFPGNPGRWATVVGIAADARYRELLSVRPAIYVPLSQMPIFAPRHLAIRTTGPVDLASIVSATLRDLAPSMRVVGASSVADRMDAPLRRPRFAAALLGLMASLVLALAGVGVYGLTAAAVRSRTREMGVRAAVGARARDLALLVLREAAGLATIGGLFGMVGALLSGRFLVALLFGLDAADPVTYAVALVSVLAIALAAGLRPALRAGRTDPMTVLRSD